MSMEVNGVVFPNSVLELELRVGTLERLLESIVMANQGRVQAPTLAQVAQIRKEVVADLQKRYPNAGIEYVPPAGHSGQTA